jgi:hypothetical protein
MSQYFTLHPVNPQLRLIHRTVEILRAGGVGEAGELCKYRSHPAERPARDGGAGRRTRDGS